MGQSREQKRIVPVFFTSRSNLHLPDTVRRPRGGVEGCLKSMCEQTVNRRFCRFLSSIYMGSTTSSLDFLGVLWYHMEVKLGCYATASHGFDSVFCALRAGNAGAAIGWRLGNFPSPRVENRKNSVCPAPYASRCFRPREPLGAVTPTSA